MSLLDTRIPPPVVTLIVGGAMWAVSGATPDWRMPPVAASLAAPVLFVAGAIVITAGAASFIRARTSMNPMDPGSASSLVTTGIYRVTRNPMYLADLLFLLAWGTYLGSPAALAGAPLFVLYIDRFQIAVEERVMADLFGQQYEAYRARVRRWL